MARGLPEVVVKVWASFTKASSCNQSLLQGVSTISRAIINIKDKNDDRGKKGDKELLVEGYGLQKCMITEGPKILFHLESGVLRSRRCPRRTDIIKSCY